MSARPAAEQAKLDRAVQAAIDAAPPLTDDQREKVVRLLRQPATAGGSQ